MNVLPEFLAETGPTLAFGATALLVLGAVGISLVRSPIHRQRIGELTIFALLIWLILACLPLPRFNAGEILRRVGTTHHPIDDDKPVGWQGRVARVRPAILEPATISRKPPTQIQATSPTRMLDQRENPGEANPAASGGSDTLPMPSPAIMSTGETPVPPGASSIVITNASETRSAFVAIAYLIGALGFVISLALGRLFLAIMNRTSASPGSWLARELETLRASLKVGRVRLRVSRRCRRAISFGIVRPTIVLPARICRPEHREPLRHVLLHELAHVRRRDALGLGLFNLAMPLIYWNPLYWWIRSRTGLAAELVADDWAAGQSDKQDYVRELIELIKTTKRARFPRLAGVGMFQSPTQFHRRMKMLIERDKPLDRQCTRTARVALTATFVLVLALLTSIAGVRPVQAQDPANQPEAPAASGEPTEKPDAPELLEERIEQPEAPLQKALEDAQATIERLEKEREVLRHELEQLKKEVGQLRNVSKQELIEQRFDAAKQRVAFAEQVAKLRMQRALSAKNADGSSPTALSGLFDSAQAQLDVVHLAIAYADALEAQAVAEAELQRSQPLARKGFVDPSELEAAQRRIELSERKLRMLRSIAEGTRQAAIQEAELLAQMRASAKAAFEKGEVRHSELLAITIREGRAKQRAEILSAILE